MIERLKKTFQKKVLIYHIKLQYINDNKQF